MSEALTYWTMFIAIAAVIAVAGPYVSRNGDIIAEKTNLSGGWIGLVLVASAGANDPAVRPDARRLLCSLVERD